MHEKSDVDEPIDPDVDSPGTDWARHRGVLLLVIGLGGGLGALARYGLSRWLPVSPGDFPWSTFVTNASGCLLIGVLMVLVTEAYQAHPVLRPFLGVGVLGGYTTFSTYSAEVLDLLGTPRAVLAFGYLAGTVLVALLAVTIGVLVTRAATGQPAWRQA